jgi:hypothetical protein
MRVFVLTVAFASALVAAGTTYYASPDATNDTNCATSNSDPLKLGYAVDTCLQSGDTLILRPGPDPNNPLPYILGTNPGIVLDKRHSGTIGAHTVIKAEVRQKAMLVYAGPFCQVNNITGNVTPIIIRVGNDNPTETSYIDIVDLDIRSSEGRGGVAIGLYGHDITVQGNHIHDMDCREPCVDGFNAGVVSSEDHVQEGNHHIIGNYFNDISRYGTACKEDEAIFYRQMHGVIANNVILHSAGNAIQLRCDTGGTEPAPLYVVNNTITNVQGTGIVYYGNSGPGGCTEGACKG